MSISASKKFYTNTDKLLSDLIKDVIPGTKNLSFLVGFFYFSGFESLYKELVDKDLRVLVGMDVEVGIANVVSEKFQYGKDGLNTNASEFLDQLKDVFNNSDMFDSRVNMEAMDLFINKIIDGSLQIKKTRSPNHSKLYLFERTAEFNEGGSYPGVMITGSSNLSYSGMQGRHEFNYLTRDPNDFEESKKFFDYLWDNESEQITTGGEDDQVVKMLQQETWLQVPSPYYLYVKLLHALFGNEETIKTPREITGERYRDLAYQLDAIRNGVKIIKQHSGVIIADVVGLGKSIIGSAIAHNLQSGHEGHGKKVLIIAPPHLIPQWEEYAEEFKVNAQIFSSGKIDAAWEYNEKYGDNIGVLMVDEAHKYRNDETIDYGYLHQIAQGKQVLLLTATPFNNSPEDIFNLIKFFQVPSKSTLQTTNNLEYDMQTLQIRYKAINKSQRDGDISPEELKIEADSIASQMRGIIWPILIRRSRIDLAMISDYKEDLDKQGYEFAEVSIDTLEYDLGNLSDLYTKTLQELIAMDEETKLPLHYKGARYRTLTMIKKEYKSEYKDLIQETLGYKFELLEGRQKNMPFFIRRLLVARFESSKKAFLNTLQSLIGSIDLVYKYIEHFDALPVIKKGSLPDIEELFEDDQQSFFTEELQEGKLGSVKQYIESKNGLLIKREHMDPKFFEYLDQDRDYLKHLYANRSIIDEDPKFESLHKDLQEQLASDPERKIVIFSSYADTIKDLSDKLSKENMRVLSVTGGTKTIQLKTNIKLNFDAGVNEAEQQDEYDVLLGTDAISEGYNLHRAGTVINYDIPYNPTRVIQRIGRINRINKKVFDTLHILNYFPTLIGESVIRSQEISTLKVQLINAILGNDTKTLSDDEELKSFYVSEKSLDGGLDAIYAEKLEEQESDNEISWDSKYVDQWKKLMREYPQIIEDLEKIPARSRVLRKSKSIDGVIVVAQKGPNTIASIYKKGDEEAYILTVKQALDYFLAEKVEEGFAPSPLFYDFYDKVRDYFKRPPSVKPNNELTKARNNFQLMKEFSKNPFFDDLIVAANLGNLPQTYLKKARSLTKDNMQEVIEYLIRHISSRSLEAMKEHVALYDDMQTDLIMIEEFNS